MAKGSALSAAIVYDFDGTLAEGNIQEHSLIPSLSVGVEEFWADVRERARRDDADEVLIYMWRLLEIARGKGEPITSEVLRSHGTTVPLFPGVETWFDRMTRFAGERGLDLRHYVISSGLREMIEGCPIFDRFERVFASRYLYDGEGNAAWPGLAINYTTKTQYVFRINKGIDNSWDKSEINRWIPPAERPVPFTRMIFLGDGDTDIPTMKMMRQQGGHSIAVFDEHRWKEASAQDKIGRLIAEDRVHFVAPADYREDSQLDVTVKGILGRIARGSADTG